MKCTLAGDCKKATYNSKAGIVMSQRIYIDQILPPIVKPWIDRGDKFILEEDGDPRHGPGRSNIAKD